MALVLNLDYARSLDRLSIVVTDNTGTGSTGYLSPNPTVADFTTFDISVTLPDPITLLPTGTPVVIDAFPSLPSASAGTFTITNEDLGLDADQQLIDGVYLFEVSADWEITEEDSGTATSTNYKVYYEIVGCCIRSLTVDAIGCGCNANSEKIQRLLLANLLLLPLQPYLDENGTETASPVEQCNQWNKAAEAILELQRVCRNENCNGCGGCN